MCCVCDTSSGMTFFKPEDGKWWWTQSHEDFYAAPKGYEKELASYIGRYKQTRMKVIFNATTQMWEARPIRKAIV